MPAISAALGQTVRDMRIRRGLTTRALAAQIQVSAGFISQIENAVTTPSLATLVKLAGALDVQIADLFQAQPAPTRLVRQSARPRLEYPEIGVIDEILSADPKKQLEVLVGYIEPGGGSGDELYTHGAASEFVLVLSGELDIRLDDEVHKLSQGDAITFSGDVPHGYTNRGSATTEVLWAMTPAAY